MSTYRGNTARPFTLKLPGVKNDFQVLSFEGVEHISQPYRFDIKLVSERRELPLADVLHQPAFLAFDAEGGGVHGQIYNVARGESGPRLTHYSVSLMPRLAFLKHRVNQRIFQNKTVAEMIAKVLEDHGILSCDYHFYPGRDPAPQREYCTQYGESDLNFIQRLCASEGMHYYFEHSETEHRVVFGEDMAFPLLEACVFNADTSMVAAQPTVKRFGVRLEARPTRVAICEYDFKHSTTGFTFKSTGSISDPGQDDPVREDYRYCSEQFNNSRRSEVLVRRAQQQHRTDYLLASGASDLSRFNSGRFVELREHPTADYNEVWLLHRVEHFGKQPQVLEEFASGAAPEPGDFTQGYRNTFEATPYYVPYRAPLTHQTPYIRGSQSAIVTGPVGQEIFCDEYGRVKVQFRWDRDGKGDECSSCWLRVASSWAGNAYGGMAIPRVGMEVVVSFWDGCPDKPYISGCVVNASNRVPYALPANKTRSVFKTLSSPGGQGSNELSIEDRKGSERIFIQAERDLDQVIKHNQTTCVGNERHDTVAANSYTEHKAEEHRTTGANRKVRVGASDHLEVSQSQHVQAGIGQYVNAGQEIHLKAGSKIVIEAGTELTLSAGGSTIILNPSGVWLNGAMVVSNGGGSPAIGSGVQLLSAGLPGLAKKTAAGEVPKPALANAQFNLMKKPRKAAESRCLICEACQENACAL